MSVIYKSKECAILDHADWMMQMIHQHTDKNKNEDMTERKMMFQDLFDLRTPFLMDDQAQKKAVELETRENNDTEETPLPRKRKRRKDRGKTQSEESDAEARHIQEVFTALRCTQEFKAHFSYIPTPQDFRLNNSQTRDLRKRFTEDTNTILPPMDSHTGNEQELQYKTVNGREYILPPGTRYICGDVRDILDHTRGRLYDLVVVDPPWSNKYIKRRKMGHGRHHGYDMMTVQDILKLPIGSIVRDDGLVAVWCTNNPTQIKDFLNGLHRWGVKLVATWYWLKVTCGGEPITQLTNPNKRPYERLFLTCKCTSDDSSSSIPATSISSIPDGLVFCSVPSGLHSHKPPLQEILQPYVCGQPQCLEVFARSLIPGWTCYGLEVLRLQHSSLFQTIT